MPQKPKSVATLTRENKLLLGNLSNAHREVADQATQINDMKTCLHQERNARIGLIGAIVEVRDDMHRIKTQLPEVQQEWFKNMTAEYMQKAAEFNIPVVLFVGGKTSCQYHTTATAGNAIDMYTSVMNENNNVKVIMDTAIDLTNSLN